MENDYYKRYEPFFGSWYIKRFIGKGSYGKVFEVERKDAFGTVYTGALKAITVPTSEDELEDLLANGMDRDSASTYFRNYAEGLNREIALMSRLKGHSNIVSYEDHDIQSHEDGMGWDMLIRMELLTPITTFQKANKPFTRRQVIQLGIDLCRALEVCQKYNIIHRDIKPANIFLSETGDFKLGDFGVARIASAATGASTRAGTVNYMAPEVFRGEKYTSNVDIYSLGLVMYQLLNANRMPLCPPYPQLMTPNQWEQANARRLAGTALPPPANADGRLAEIVLKACSPNSAERYEAPSLMRQALEAILYTEQETKDIYPEGDNLPLPKTSEKNRPVPHPDTGGETENVWVKMREASGESALAEPLPVTGTLTEKVPTKHELESECEKVPETAPDETENKTQYLFKAQEEARRKAEEEARKAEEAHRAAEEAARQAEFERREQELARKREEVRRRAKEEVPKIEEQQKEERTQPKISRRKFLRVLGTAAAASVAASGAVMVGRSAGQSASSASNSVSIPTAESIASSPEPVVETVPPYTVQYSVYRDLGGDVEGVASAIYSEGIATGPDKIVAFSDNVVQSYSARAVPNGGYDFLVWSDGWRTEKRSDADVGENFNVFAVFETNGGLIHRSDGDTSTNTSWSLKNGTLHITGTGQMPNYGFEEKEATYQGIDYIYLVSTSPWRDSSEKIKAITIDSDITSIGDWAFRFCDAKEVEIPESVEKIGDNAFSWCDKITSITLPKKLMDIGESAFSLCHSLQSIEIPQNIEVIRSDTFGMRDDQDPKLKSVTFPKTLKIIARSAFSGNTALPKIEFPDSLTYIGNYAFSGCTALTSITIPASVKYIGDSAFDGCTSLQSVTISRSCKRGENAFPSTTQINYYD